MKLTALGTGGFFAPAGQWQTNYWLEDDFGAAMLIDCGTDIRHSIAAAGKDPSKIEAVYVSHLHGDHSSLEWLGFYSRFISKKRIKFFAPVNPFYVWETLKPSMKYIEGKVAKLANYFELEALSGFPQHNNNTFLWGGGKFTVVPMPHVPVKKTDCEKNDWACSSNGLFIETQTAKTFITTDTFVNYNYKCPKNTHFDLTMEEIRPFYDQANSIFHDCETYGLVYPPGSDVHAHYEDLVKMPSHIKSKTWLIHYSDLGNKMPNAYSDGFRGCEWS